MNMIRTYMPHASIAILIGTFVLFIAVLLPNITLLSQVWGWEGITLSGKCAITLSLFGSLGTSLLPLALLTTVLSSYLTGVNLVLMWILYKRQKQFASTHHIAATSFGAVLGILTTGCAACGSVLFMSLFATAGGASILALLPLYGAEFGLFGVLLLFSVLILLVHKIRAPLVCETT